MAQQKAVKTDALEELFKKADKDKSGGLTKGELEKLLAQGGTKITESQLNEAFKFFNSDDGDQVITLAEFKAGLQKIVAFVQEIEELFNKFDTDKSGFLDRNELKKLLAATKHDFTEAEIQEIFKRADPNGDNKISKVEFTNALVST